jgi:hypothetical protein
MKKLTPILVVMLWVSFSLYAQEKKKFISGDTLAFVENAIKKVNKNVNFTIIPGPTYNATQKLGFAVLPMLVYDVNRKDTVSPPSSTAALLYFDFYGSWLTAAKQSFYWDENKWRAIIFISYGNLRSKFYGVGRDTAIVTNKDTTYVWVSQKPFEFAVTCYRKIVSHLYGGLEYDYSSTMLEGEDSAASAVIEQNGIPIGVDVESKVIPTLVWDSRNNVFWAVKGYYASLTFQFANKFLASTHNFSVLSGFVNGYHTLIPDSKKLSLAWRFYFLSSWGDAPYNELANYCRGDDVTGYTPGKYVNNMEASTQAELRYDIMKLIGISGYAGVGKIFTGIETFGQSVWLPFAGAALYINMIPYRNIRLRLNAAISRHDYGLYIGVGQLF